MQHATTLEQLRRQAAAELADISDSPFLEADWLLAHVIGLSRTRLIIESRNAPTAAQIQQMSDAVTRRRRGEPLAYILGHVGFHAIDLAVTPAVLIPRPETELLVDTVLDHLADQPGLRVADLGTGSGAIALALARARPHWQIIATDAHTDALHCARDNAKRLQIDNVAFRQGHWLAPLAGEQFEALVANPPYIDARDRHLAASALQHEPHHALVAADHGLADIAHIADRGHAHLTAGGWLFMEHGHDQQAAAQRLFQQAGYQHIRTLQDYGRKPRLTLGQHSPAAKENSEADHKPAAGLTGMLTDA